MQPLHDRSPFSKYEILSAHTSKGKDDKPILSQIVLSISNWHFNRDNQHLKFGPRCRPEDVCISIKLSSSAFVSADAAGPSLPTYNEEESSADDLSTTPTTTDDSSFSFDRNGVIIPYFAFVSLLDDINFQKYLKTVVEKFEETEGPLSKLFEQEDLNNEDREEVEEDVGRNVKKIIGRNGNPAVFDDAGDDDDHDIYVNLDSYAQATVDSNNHPNKKKRPNTPMAGGELSTNDDLDPPVKKSGGRKGAASKKWVTPVFETLATEPS